MRATKIAAVVVGSLLSVGTAAMAQNTPYDNRGAAAPYANSSGENRDTGYGQGGTAGTHPTGANVGPGRAQQNHSTGQ
jgi:hypothetical protein